MDSQQQRGRTGVTKLYLTSSGSGEPATQTNQQQQRADERRCNSGDGHKGARD
ncbi:hypothetical protein Syun_012893 [Stephania yunnanensis]|uniref:Uncharacterized protein n=1 Tax=Stephania yunnanensis TaxID=152371 RepID=A0AAP0K1N7_9MAGN